MNTGLARHMTNAPAAAPRWHESPLAWAPVVWTITSLVLAVSLHLTHAPAWVCAAFALLVFWRVLLGVRRARLPSALMRVAAMLAIAFAVLANFRTLNGLDAGSALLILMAGLKLLETRAPRDHVVLVLICYVLVLASFLHRQAWWLLPAHAVTVWVTTTALLRVTQQDALALSPGRSVRLAGRMLLQAAPLMVILFLLFPRVAGPFWALPSAGGAISGLGDEMRPGDISELSLSSDPAFRVRFHGAVPPPSERYWRGPVLREFDGYTWSRGSTYAPRARVNFSGPVYQYTLMLERSRRGWVFALDLPEVWPRSQVDQRLDYQLVSADVTERPTTFLLGSRTRYTMEAALPRRLLHADTRLPGQANPRTRALARQLRAQSSSDADFAASVLSMFATQGFEYTLAPPRIDHDSVDDFLFGTRSGFCAHYASAFTTLMRAADIPARVVTGYQGAELNRLSDYYIVRQSDAHAWSEIWLEGRGWVRVDPTAAVAPDRIQRGLLASMPEEERLPDRFLRTVPWLEDLRFAWDAMNTFWRERVVEFGSRQQVALLDRLGIREPDWRSLTIFLVGGVVVALLVLAWQLRRELNRRTADPVQSAYLRFCRRLERIGLRRLPHEGPRQFAHRVRVARPDLAAASDSILLLYESLRYGTAARPAAIVELRSRVRQFHARGRPR